MLLVPGMSLLTCGLTRRKQHLTSAILNGTGIEGIFNGKTTFKATLAELPTIFFLIPPELKVNVICFSTKPIVFEGPKPYAEFVMFTLSAGYETIFQLPYTEERVRVIESCIYPADVIDAAAAYRHMPKEENAIT